MFRVHEVLAKRGPGNAATFVGEEEEVMLHTYWSFLQGLFEGVWSKMKRVRAFSVAGGVMRDVHIISHALVPKERRHIFHSNKLLIRRAVLALAFSSALGGVRVHLPTALLTSPVEIPCWHFGSLTPKQRHVLIERLAVLATCIEEICGTFRGPHCVVVPLCQEMQRYKFVAVLNMCGAYMDEYFEAYISVFTGVRGRVCSCAGQMNDAASMRGMRGLTVTRMCAFVVGWFAEE
jgi:hypothetical protein